MTNIEKILESLTPEKRILLEKKLKEEGSKYGVFPLSYAQQRLWFIENLQPGNTAYNIPSALKLTGELNFDALKKSLNKIIQRHEILRTYISIIDETPLQIVEKQFDTQIEQIQLKEKEEGNKEKKLNEIIKDRINKPFNLSELPLFRITLISLSDTETVLLIVMHHIISDGWSAGIFINELSQLYSAYSQENDFELPPLEIQYADFAKWQKKWLQGKVKEEQLAYWEKQLEDVPVLELPADFNRPKVQTFNGSLVKGELDKSTSDELKKISQEEGTTFFMSLLAVFNILLYKHSGQTDFAVGTPIANRNNQQIENLIGFFVNTLALRSEINAELSFKEYLQNFKNTVLSAYANQDLPFEMIIEELQPERDMSRSPIFQVMFTFQNKSNFELKLNDIQLSPIEMEASISKFDLSLNITEMNDGRMLIGFEYNKDIFREESIVRIYEHFKKIISDIIKDSTKKIKDINILTNKEKLLLTEWNKTDKEYPFDKNIMEFFEEQVTKNPNSVAVEFNEEQLTYSELNERVNRLANYLTEFNAEKNSFVVLLFERSPEMVISILAVMKSGAAYLPIDPEQPAERINFIINDAEAKIVLTHKSFENNITAKNVKVINVDKSKEEISAQKTSYKITIRSNGLAYCIYTSGSTGKPKGTLLHHKGLLNRILWMKDELNLKREDVFLQKTPYTFDVSVWEFFLPLINGNKLVIAKPEGHKDPFYLQKLIVEKNISVIHFVPSMLKVFLDTPDVEKCKSLKYVICSGEALSVNLQNRFFNLFDSTLYNFYGPTEATVDVTFWKCDNNLFMSQVPIGKAIANTQVYVLDSFLNPLPVGVAGELYIGGVNLAYGYLNKPELTAEKFIPNHLTGKKGERLYKTGDLVKTLPDGNIVFLNRIDNQVKLRGLRIELGEIEYELKSIDFIEDALVSVYKENQNEFLVAYVIANDNEENLTKKIKRTISKTLPDYMVPTSFIYLKKFPLTSSGKIDRKKLPKPNETKSKKEEAIVKPVTETEKLLIETISGLLNLKEVSTADNFFSIGGHSLLATQLLIRLKKKLSIEIPLKSIFENPVIKDFAKVIDNYLTKDETAEIIEIEKVSRKNNLKLSYQQQRVWFLDQLDPMNSSYNIPLTVKIKGKLNLEILDETINKIVSRQEILRSYVQTVEGEPFVKIVDDPDIKIDVIDSTNKNEDDIYKLCKKDFSKPFALNKFPLFRIKIYKLNENEHFLSFVIHHIISDGWSGSIFIKEFITIYADIIDNRQSNLTPLKIQYVDFANWQRNYLSGELLKEKINFWKNYLAGAPSLLELPTDKPRPAVQTFIGASKRFSLSEKLSEQIKDLAAQTNTTVFMVLTAALNILLSKYSNQKDICIGSPVANRKNQAIESLIGFFVNTIVVRSDLSGNPTLNEFLMRTKKSLLDAFSNQDVPFEKLVDSLEVERSVSHSPLFQVMFTFQNLPQSNFKLPGLEFEMFELESDIAKFDINLTMSETNNSILTGSWEYNTDLFEASTIERMIEHYKILLNEFTADINKNIDDVQIILDNEKQLLLTDWNDTSVKYDDKISLAEVFENAAKKYTNNIAVNFNNQTITYKELDEKSNQLANILIKKGITLDSLVGFYFERSIESIISIIAIWKAGAAYIAIDPSYPDERVNYMIEDSGIKIVVTHRNYENKFEKGKINLIYIDEINNLDQTNNLNIKINSENLAYIIYTSGSTGKPKGVMIRQKSVLNLANELYNKIYSKGNKLKVSLNAPLAFDASVQQLVALFFGHTLYIIPQETRLDAEELLKFIRHNELDVFDCVPTQLKTLLDEGFAVENKFKPSFVLPGGEPIDKKMWNSLIQINEVKFFNMYGPTECTVDSTICEINKEITKPSIGKQINNVTHFVLDTKLNLLPIGIKGELYIGGAGIARGYLNKPGLTSERFIPNPFANQPGERIYKTGDIVRYLPDGNIEYIERIDSQVKLRGFRIELGEIESILISYPNIEEAIVIVREDQPNVKNLVAYYTSNEMQIDNNKLEKYLAENLPEYMIPSFFINIENIPLTPNGKVNRKALPKPQHSDIIQNEEFIAPTTEKEILLAEIWKELLGFDNVGVNDNFFKLGGDSIVAIQMIAKAKQKGLQITPVQIFQNQTLQKLAMVAKKTDVVIAEQNLITGVAPLTPIQKYFFENDFEEPNHWNQSIFLKVNETLDEKIFKETVTEIIKHHDELRAKFEIINNSWRQNILQPRESVPFEFVDLTDIKESELKNKIESLNQKYQESLNIKEGKVIKFVVYKVSDKESGILIVAHHLVIDGVSWRILIDNLLTAYNSLKNNKKIVLPPKTTSFKTWAEFLIEYSKSENLLKEKEYWYNISNKNIPIIEKDFDNADNFESSRFEKGTSLTVDETKYLLTDIHEIYNTQINEILITALLLAFNKLQGKRTMLIHLEGHGREQLSTKYDVSGTIGWFTSLFPLYLDMKDSVEIGDMIKTVKEQLRNIPNKGIGYGILRYLSDDMELKNKLKKLDKAQITFNYLGQFDQSVPENSPFEMAKEFKGIERSLKNRRTSLIDITTVVSNDIMNISIAAGKNQFSENTVSEFLDKYKLALQEIINHCKGNNTVEFTASDFDLIDLEDDQLSSVLDKLNEDD